MQLPLIVVALGCVLLVVPMYLFKPRFAVCFTVLAILSNQTLAQVSGVGSLRYLDEATVALSVLIFPLRRVALGRPLRGWMGGRWWCLYFFAGAISTLAHGVNLVWASDDAFLFLKGPLLAFAVAQIEWSHRDLRRTARVAAILFGLVVVLGLVNLSIPASWAAHVARSGRVDYRGGLPSLVGPFTDPIGFGQVCALAAIAAAAYSRAGLGSAKRGILSGVLGTILSFRRKSIVALPLGILAVVMAAKRTRPRAGFLLASALLVPLVLVLAWPVIANTTRVTYVEYLENPNTAGRTVLTRDSIGIAVDSIPLGQGFARFASLEAGVHYSPIYVSRGYEKIYGLGPPGSGNNLFLTDTFWPAILGETGFLGAIGYVGGLVSIWRRARRQGMADDPLLRFLGLTVCGWSVEYFVESLAAPVYSSPPSYGLLFGLAGTLMAVASGYADHDVPAHARSADAALSPFPSRPVGGRERLAELVVPHRRATEPARGTA